MLLLLNLYNTKIYLIVFLISHEIYRGVIND